MSEYMLFALDLHYNYILHGNFHLIDTHTLLLTCIGYTEPCCVVDRVVDDGDCRWICGVSVPPSSMLPLVDCPSSLSGREMTRNLCELLFMTCSCYYETYNIHNACNVLSWTAMCSYYVCILLAGLLVNLVLPLLHNNYQCERTNLFSSSQ